MKGAAPLWSGISRLHSGVFLWVSSETGPQQKYFFLARKFKTVFATTNMVKG